MFRRTYLDEEGKLCVHDPAKRPIRVEPDLQAVLEEVPEGRETILGTIHSTIPPGFERAIKEMPLLTTATGLR
jgi:hypothetical protein